MCITGKSSIFLSEVIGYICLPSNDDTDSEIGQTTSKSVHTHGV